MDFFSIGLGLAGLSCVLGILWRVRGWPGRRLACGHHISSKRPACQRWRRRPISSCCGAPCALDEWLVGPGHMLVLLGFIPLLLLHALDDIVTRSLISGYEPTLGHGNQPAISAAFWPCLV